MIWNSDLVETLELENLLAQAVVHHAPAAIARRAAARMHMRTSRARRQGMDEAHRAWRDGNGKVDDRLSTSHLYTLSNEVQVFPPKARVY